MMYLCTAFVNWLILWLAKVLSNSAYSVTIYTCLKLWCDYPRNCSKNIVPTVHKAWNCSNVASQVHIVHIQIPLTSYVGLIKIQCCCCYCKLEYRYLPGYFAAYCDRCYYTCSSCRAPSKVLQLTLATVILHYMRPTKLVRRIWMGISCLEFGKDIISYKFIISFARAEYKCIHRWSFSHLFCTLFYARQDMTCI